MVRFAPKFMQVLVFDLEAYVPKEDRIRRYGTSLTVNPYKTGHTLLGGVFRCEIRLQTKYLRISNTTGPGARARKRRR
jgi:hypothetical protein